MRQPVICVHALNGRTMFVRLGEDNILWSKKPLVAVIRGQRYEIKENRKEVEKIIREA
jgi:hypothetical protein